MNPHKPVEPVVGAEAGLVVLAVTVEVAQVAFVGSNQTPFPYTAIVFCAKISEVLIPLCTKYDLSLGRERKGK